MNKGWNIATWSLGFILLLAMVAFSGNRRLDMAITEVEVYVNTDKHQYFISTDDVQKIIREEHPNIDSLLYREININVLEERLDNHPSIRKAEVYSALDGKLRVDVSQKQPMFRVHGSTGDYYIAEAGDSMALSPNFSAKVPLVTGAISAESEKQLFDFFVKVQQNEFYKNFFEGVHIDDNEDWVLYPKPGRHRVLLGSNDDIDAKLNKLRAFYKSVVDKENIDQIKILNLAYDGQVICTKY